MKYGLLGVMEGLDKSYNIDFALSNNWERYRYHKNLTLKSDHNIQIVRESDKQGQPCNWHGLGVLPIWIIATSLYVNLNVCCLPVY